MNRRRYRPTWLPAAALIALSAGCAADSAPQSLPGFALTNQSGAVIRTEQLRGRVTIISFMFTACPEECPLVVSQLARAQADVLAAELGPRVRFVTITLDPVADTPDVLRRYASRFGADTSAWDFLTGDPDEVRRLVHALGVVAIGEKGRLGHDSPVLLADAHGDIVRRYVATPGLAARLLDDIRRNP